jgi:Icc-related predicted phosphoesterase
MIIVSITDIHGDLEGLAAFADAFSSADVVLLTGDLTHFGHADDVASILDAVRQHNPHVLAVHGNCDHPDVAEYLSHEGVSLHGCHVVRDGVAFVGLGGSIACPVPTPGQLTDANISDLLGEAVRGLQVDAPVVLVSHQPPADTCLDVVAGGRHVGSRAVRDFIDDRRPLACFCGHIHEASGTDQVRKTRLLNPGPARKGRYGYAEVLDGELKAFGIRAVR